MKCYECTWDRRNIDILRICIACKGEIEKT